MDRPTKTTSPIVRFDIRKHPEEAARAFGAAAHQGEARMEGGPRQVDPLADLTQLRVSTGST
jgi:hypothetical protein